MIIKLGADYMSHGDDSFCAKNLIVLSHSKYGLQTCFHSTFKQRIVICMHIHTSGHQMMVSYVTGIHFFLLTKEVLPHKSSE